MQKYTILGIGNPFYDRFAFVDDTFLIEQGLPKGDTTLTEDRNAIDEVWNSAPKQHDHRHGKLGGSCTNVIKTLANLGHSCALCGIIGSDDIGKEVLAKLNHTGIVPLMSQGKKSNGVVNCFVTPDTQRTMHTYLGSASEFSDKNLERQYFEPIRHLHLEGYSAYYDNTLERCIQLAKKRGATISLDLASPNVIKHFRDIIDKCIPEVDYLFCNTLEAQALCSTTSPQAALEQFSDGQTIIATAGADGCWVKPPGTSAAKHYKALTVHGVIDTTGAGDFFDAGFLHGIFTKRSIAECVDIGNRAASYVITRLGTDLPDAAWHQLKKEIL